MAHSEKYILFQLAGQTFAVHVEHVISIERLQPITAVPHSKAFIGQQEIVLKSLGDYLGDVFAISGATILGDGQVALIIDPNALIK